MMKIRDAIAQKIKKICLEKKISLNQLANMCYLRQSTLQTIMDGKSKNPKMLTVIRICDGLNVKLKDFFDDKLFEHLERED